MVVLTSTQFNVARASIAESEGFFRLFDPKAVHLYGEDNCLKKL